METSSMLLKKIKKALNSIFVKLLIVLLLIGFCMNFSLVIFIKHLFEEARKVSFSKNIAQYTYYLLKDLGNPPNFEKAKQIAKNAALNIRYESKDTNWSTSPAIPPISSLKLKPCYKNSNLKVPICGKKHIVVAIVGNGRIAFSIAKPLSFERVHKQFIYGLIIILTTIMGSAYVIIRWLLHPIKNLSEGVKQVSLGNFKYRIPEKKNDELGNLSRSFNSMSEKVQKMLHAKEQLLLDVSHELRSPITRIKIALEFLVASNAKDNIVEDIDEVEKMITELLENARLHHAHTDLKRTQTNLVDLIQTAIQRFQNDTDRIQIESVDLPIIVNIDQTYIKTVLENIFSNALKYAQNTTTPIKVKFLENENDHILQIIDKGAGIPEEELPYIFEPFYRVDKSRSKKTGGYGLGLNLCKTIMEAHQGKIEIASELGKETRVYLYFKKI